MVGLGIAAGIAFPFFVILLGVSAEKALTPWFFAATLCAGLAVGGMNVIAANIVIRPRLRQLSDKMGAVENAITHATFSGDWSRCDAESCCIEVDSEDEIGDSARAFNRLIQALERAQMVETAVNEFTHALSGELDFDDLSHKALDMLLAHTRSHAGAIVVEHGGHLEVAASVGIKDADDILLQDHVLRAFKNRAESLFSVPEDLLVEGVVVSFRPREVSVVPVEFNNVPIAAIVLVSSTGFSTDAMRMVRLFREGLGLALQNAMTHRQIQLIAALDPLTGIYNRRFGLARLNEEFARAARSRAPLALIVFDIDHFKDVNDTYGHLLGDRVLVAVTKATKKTLREGDILMRYGGEEFCAVLPGAAIEDAQHIAERLLVIVQDTGVAEGDQVVHVTVSAGIAAYPDVDVDNETQLFKTADTNLYRAKRTGRNRVVGGARAMERA